jgi:hypothetical protein
MIKDLTSVNHSEMDDYTVLQTNSTNSLATNHYLINEWAIIAPTLR